MVVCDVSIQMIYMLVWCKPSEECLSNKTMYHFTVSHTITSKVHTYGIESTNLVAFQFYTRFKVYHTPMCAYGIIREAVYPSPLLFVIQCSHYLGSDISIRSLFDTSMPNVSFNKLLTDLEVDTFVFLLYNLTSTEVLCET